MPKEEVLELTAVSDDLPDGACVTAEPNKFRQLLTVLANREIYPRVTADLVQMMLGKVVLTRVQAGELLCVCRTRLFEDPRASRGVASTTADEFRRTTSFVDARTAGHAAFMPMAPEEEEEAPLSSCCSSCQGKGKCTCGEVSGCCPDCNPKELQKCGSEVWGMGCSVLICNICNCGSCDHCGRMCAKHAIIRIEDHHPDITEECEAACGQKLCDDCLEHGTGFVTSDY